MYLFGWKLWLGVSELCSLLCDTLLCYWIPWSFVSLYFYGSIASAHLFCSMCSWVWCELMARSICGLSTYVLCCIAVGWSPMGNRLWTSAFWFCEKWTTPMLLLATWLPTVLDSCAVLLGAMSCWRLENMLSYHWPSTTGILVSVCVCVCVCVWALACMCLSLGVWIYVLWRICCHNIGL